MWHRDVFQGSFLLLVLRQHKQQSSRTGRLLWQGGWRCALPVWHLLLQTGGRLKGNLPTGWTWRCQGRQPWFSCSCSSERTSRCPLLWNLQGFGPENKGCCQIKIIFGKVNYVKNKTNWDNHVFCPIFYLVEPLSHSSLIIK